MEQLFNPEQTALVVIDLQKWLGNQYAPHTAQQVIKHAAALANAFRNHHGLVNLVRVSSKDMKDLPRPILDQSPPPMNLSEGWDDFVPEMEVSESDHIITKKQWGAFYGTDLDLQLRRRGINTIVLCGIATGIGVDTTAREAFMHGYNVIFVEDAMTGFSQAEHDHCITFIFPRIGRIRSTEQILDVLSN
jgi:nicotinamidase-related amidase